VYVHCTAGIYRSPQLIILFLVNHRKMSLPTALELVKQKRGFVRPSVDCLLDCLQILNEDKYNDEYFELA